MNTTSDELRQKIFELETDVKHLRNELCLTKQEYEDSSAKYLDIYFKLDRLIKERTLELEGANQQLRLEIDQRIKAENIRKQLENQLRQSQKMEAIGTMAGGIAHEFNNILAAILGFADLSLRKLPAESPERENIQIILQAGNRAKELVQQILTFSHRSEQDFQPLELHLIIKESIKMLKASIPATIRIHQKIEDSYSPVLADPTQIHQLMINLCNNAVHAMDEKGTLTISLSPVEIKADDEYFIVSGLQAAKYLKLSVSDTGKGIEKQIKERMFDPFFTTKKIGEGTGMGLSVVHGIVNNHGGSIHVESEIGKGTVFHVFLPISDQRAISPGIEETLENLPQGGEHILLVDDELHLAHLGKQMFESLGYEVTVRTSSIEAFEAFRMQPDRFDLIITDQTMPNMTGGELAGKILQIRPSMPIILYTGYSNLIDESQARDIGISAFMMKPIDKADMAKTIRQLLDRPQPL